MCFKYRYTADISTWLERRHWGVSLSLKTLHQLVPVSSSRLQISICLCFWKHFYIFIHIHIYHQATQTLSSKAQPRERPISSHSLTSTMRKVQQYSAKVTSSTLPLETPTTKLGLMAAWRHNIMPKSIRLSFESPAQSKGDTLWSIVLMICWNKRRR